MGLFSKKSDRNIAKDFMSLFERGSEESENEFLDSLNAITTAVEEDGSYSTNDKLKIFELISQISNCSPVERTFYAKKLEKLLK